jgi:hypothetical protein
MQLSLLLWKEQQDEEGTQKHHDHDGVVLGVVVSDEVVLVSIELLLLVLLELPFFQD